MRGREPGTQRDPRRERGPLLLLAAAGALVALAAGAPTWVSAAVLTATGNADVTATGRDAAPVATALALVSLTAVVASTLGRRVARALAAVVLVLGGAGIVASSASVLTGPASTLTAAGRSAAGTTEVTFAADPSVRPWPLVSAAGGVLVAVAGTAVLVRSRRWAQVPAGPSRHERDATRAERNLAPATDPAAAWDSLTHGDDPTR